MKTTIQFHNYKGELTDAPADLKHTVASYDGNTIVWSRSGKKHQVRYALDAVSFTSAESAAEQFGYCVLHLERCNGKLD